jgi:hypothetical protein
LLYWCRQPGCHPYVDHSWWLVTYTVFVHIFPNDLKSRISLGQITFQWYQFNLRIIWHNFSLRNMKMPRHWEEQTSNQWMMCRQFIDQECFKTPSFRSSLRIAEAICPPAANLT